MHVVYTDGACINNGSDTQAFGGAGIYCDSLDIASSVEWKYDEPPTNQKCELWAAILGLTLVNPEEGPIEIHTDSEYVVKGITEWIYGWMIRGWMNTKKQPVKNRQWWELLFEMTENRDVEFVHVRGHSGIEGNENADELAYTAANCRKLTAMGAKDLADHFYQQNVLDRFVDN